MHPFVEYNADIWDLKHEVFYTMRCMNCGLPLSPVRMPNNCPRCGAALYQAQSMEQQQPFQQAGQQAGWGNMGAAPQYNPWGQEVPSNTFQPFVQQVSAPPNQFGGIPGSINETPGAMRSGLPQSQLAPRRPLAPTPKKSGVGMKIALVGLVMATLLLAFIAILGFTRLGKSAPSTASVNTSPSSTTQQQPTVAAPTAVSASPTVSASPSATGTAYPGQQYIDGAQMATGVDKATAQPQQPTTTFPVGSQMYVTFNLHPPSQGGEVCILWYLNGKQLATNPPIFTINVSPSYHASYAYSIYNNAGPAYVELYWASDKTCADKVLAQHVDFTVTT